MLVVVGDVEPERIFELAERSYTLKKGETPLVDYAGLSRLSRSGSILRQRFKMSATHSALFGCTFKLPEDPVQAVRKLLCAGHALQCAGGHSYGVL